MQEEDSKRFRGGNKRKSVVFLSLLLATLLFLGLASCGKGESLPTDSPATTPPVQTSAPSDNGVSTGKTRGLPGSRSERMTVGLTDSSLFNTNPFASGGSLFPVDPQGVCQPIYETLLLYDPEALEYVPHLAESVTLREDGVTIRLDSGRSWHDGYPITSGDLLFSIQAHQTLKTEAGLIFAELDLGLVADEETVLDIGLDSGQDRALPRLLDALTKALILPMHRWQPLISNGFPSNGTSLPMVGSGPWAFLFEDDFSLSLERKIPGDEGGPLYLTVLKYKGPGYAAQALEHNDLDLLMGSSGQQAEDVTEVWGGEVLAGITVNSNAGDWLPVPAIRQLLGLAADPVTTGSLLFPGSPAIERTGLLTVPAAMANLEGAKLQESALIPDEETIGRLLEEASLIRHAETGLLIAGDGNSLPALILLYPQASGKAEEACQAFRVSAKKLGFDIVLRAVRDDQLEDYYEAGRYDLIYWETRPDETPADLAGRLLEILPGNGDEADTGRDLIIQMEQAVSRKERIKAMEELTIWLLDEALFIPLGAGRVSAGIWKRDLVPAFDFQSVLPAFRD